MPQFLTLAPVSSARSARLKKVTEQPNNLWMKCLLATTRIGAKFARVFMRDVEQAVDRTRVAEDLGPSWTVTYAADDGKDVYIRFDREPETPGWEMVAVRVNKATGGISVIARTALQRDANAR